MCYFWPLWYQKCYGIYSEKNKNKNYIIYFIALLDVRGAASILDFEGQTSKRLGEDGWPPIGKEMGYRK